MGLHIEFVFADGDSIDAHMGYSSFHKEILARMTQREIDKWFESDAEGTYYGPYVIRVWEICKLCHYIDYAETRVPIYMVFS